MKSILFALSLGAALPAHAAITVLDDEGKPVTLQKPALRIIALAPHVTELLFAAGGGSKIAGAVSYSDYPEQARRIPRIGDNRMIDMERVASMRPDLVVAWMHGSSQRQIEQLRALGVPIYHSEPRKLADIPNSVRRLGRLMGTEAAAEEQARQLEGKLAALGKKYAGRSTVRTFYQVWDKPLYTLNGAHIVSDAIRLCGGENVFASMKITAPVVDIESVVQKDPEAIFSTAARSGDEGGIGMWRSFATVSAVRYANLFRVDGDLLNRAGPRMIEGAASLCEHLDTARQRRNKP
ncbi:cobalamin-binding protein [Massilia sp. GCM10020059]|uniref:Cobalamin-binding protein n=1 Tax=Massilia agrisoli TaxID=2892444 RepID=A0ABS8IX35_9BURK|nr:cobalamin-binding protein [Massilia agrisoli]MCC6072526.1 cobalamin-binding protein [Massilia agrisoli]